MRPKDVQNFRCTDTGNAELFAALYGSKLRYDHARKRWLLWADHWWTDDCDGALVRLAKATIRWRSVGAKGTEDPDEHKEHWKWAKRSESRQRLDSMLKLAESERPIADSGKNWDADPLLLGASNGVVDLRTGKLRAGTQSDHITRHSDIEFNPRGSCLRWDKFLNQIFNEDEQLIDFVRRAVGYTLTGSTSEQVLFLCYGTGANGKSTFLEALRYVLGGYAYNLPFSSFELRSRPSIPNDLAALEGRRFVTALEANESAPLNEARIKVLTGCDPITARYLYGEYFTYIPVAKFWLAFNHKPEISDDSEGFWRRIRLIPFEQRFPRGKADDQLLSTLKAEAPGILAWAVRGCLEWQKHGLINPKAISDATQSYREESDPLKEFLDEKCVLGPPHRIASRELWAIYSGWARANGYRELSRPAFTRRLKTLGLKTEAVGHAKVTTWFGISLRTTAAGVRVDAGMDSPLLVN